MSLLLPLEDSPYRLDEFGPIFILGCPRSGTTFLSKCLAAVDGLEEFVGVLAPPRIMHLIGSCEDKPYQKELMNCIRDVFWQSFWRRRYYRHERLLQLLQKNISIAQFMAAPSIDGTKFCYKEPFLCFAAEEFANYFPNARFIHIIRDGRDNADSLERTYPDALSDEVLSDGFLAGNKNSEIGMYRENNGVCVPWWVAKGSEAEFIELPQYGKFIWMWKEMVGRARNVKAVDKSRYFEIRYEDFVKDPMEWAGRILNFLDVPMNERVRKKLKSAFASSIGISLNNQKELQRGIAQKVAGELLAELGYTE
ncbi:sulfotransferase family protein [Zhongshania sp.]|jgi:hypothetical protein|uniref:sulfotransferase family protein n=1 Tax=Zhongshania sp. TaxID=1971902 RepID=UPI0039E353DA